MNQETPKLSLGSSLEILASGVSNIIGLLASSNPALAPVSSLVSFGVSGYQINQINKLTDALKERIENLEKCKLDTNALNSDEFIALVSQAVDVASKTISDIKREKIANALINSVILTGRNVRNKEMLFRLLSSISDDEINMLGLIYKNWESSLPKGKEKRTFDLLDRGTPPSGGIQESTLESLLHLSQSDVRATGQGLSQLGLASLTDPYFWGLTTLGRKLTEWTLVVWNDEDLSDQV